MSEKIYTYSKQLALIYSILLNVSYIITTQRANIHYILNYELIIQLNYISHVKKIMHFVVHTVYKTSPLTLLNIPALLQNNTSILQSSRHLRESETMLLIHCYCSYQN